MLELSGLHTTFGVLLLQAIEDRINERRTEEQMGLSTLLAYLENSKFLESTRGLCLKYASRNEIAKVARDLYMRLFLEGRSHVETVPSDGETDSESETAPLPPKRTCSDKLKEFLEKNKGEEPKRTLSDWGSFSSARILKEIKKEMDTYEASGHRIGSLDKVLDATYTQPVWMFKRLNILKKVIFHLRRSTVH